MGSVRFGMVADALSQGLGLFAGKKADEERERIERQWKEAMANLAADRQDARATETNRLADERADKREASDAARFETGQENQTERARLSNERITNEGELNRSAREDEFDTTRTDRAEESLFKRIDAARERAIKSIDEAKAMMDETAEERITNAFMQERDEMIVGHVLRLGQRGAPGYQIDSPGSIESKFIELGMGPDSATTRTNELGSMLWPGPGPTSSTTGGPGGVPFAPDTPGFEQAQANAPPPLIPPPAPAPAPAPTQQVAPVVATNAAPGVQPANTAAAGSMPVNMVQPAGNTDLYQPPAGPQPWGVQAGQGIDNILEMMKKQASPETGF
jgi:hypothetical protein